MIEQDLQQNNKIQEHALNGFISNSGGFTFDCMSEWDSNSREWDIASDMAKCMTESYRDQQLQEGWINRLQAKRHVNNPL